MCLGRRQLFTTDAIDSTDVVMLLSGCAEVQQWFSCPLRLSLPKSGILDIMSTCSNELVPWQGFSREWAV